MGNVSALWYNEIEMVGYCPACKDIHSLQKNTHILTEETSVRTIAILVDCALGIFKSCAFNYKLSGGSS